MEKVRLKDIGTIVTGNTPSKKKSEYYINNDICFFKPSDIEDCGVIKLKKSEEYISEKARNKVIMLPKNSVLVTCIGTIGKVGIIEREGCCNQQINAIIPNNNINSKYLAYLILSKKYWLQQRANAPVVPIINKSDFSNVEIIIHNIEEQNVIVNRLDKVQEIIDLRKKQIEELEELIKSLFIKMFGNPINNSKKIKIEDMTSVCEIIDGDRGKNYPKAEEFFEKEYCLFLNAKNVTNNGFSFENCMFITEEKDKLLRKGKLQREDVVLTTRGTVGNIAFYTNAIPFDNIRINSGMVILRMNKAKINEIFFIEQFRLQLNKIKNKVASGSAQPQLPISKMKSIKVIIPKIEEQNKYANFVQLINKQKFIVEKSLKEAEKLQESLMNKYFG